MRLRIDLACGQWRVIECDEWSLDGALTRFTKDGNTVLIPDQLFRAHRTVAADSRPAISSVETLLRAQTIHLRAGRQSGNFVKEG